MSHVKNISFYIFIKKNYTTKILDKVMELVVGGSVISGAYLSSFLEHWGGNERCLFPLAFCLHPLSSPHISLQASAVPVRHCQGPGPSARLLPPPQPFVLPSWSFLSWLVINCMHPFLVLSGASEATLRQWGNLHKLHSPIVFGRALLQIGLSGNGPAPARN